MKYSTLVTSAFAALTVLTGIHARADNMASIAITPATGAVTLVPHWGIGGSLAGFHLMAQDLSLGGGANQFYSIKGTPIPAGGDISAFTRYIAGSGAATNHADIGSKLTPDSYSALTSADPDVGYGSVNFYFIHHKSSGDYFTVIVPGSATASAVTDLKPMSGPGGPATLGASGYFGLTFAAANLGYGLNYFYYLRTDPVTGFTIFGTLDPALLATSADKFDLGIGGYNALAFTGTEVGFGTDQMYYLRLDPITGFTIFGTLQPLTGRASDIANLGSVYSTLTFVPGDVGFGPGQFYMTGAVNPTWQSVSFAAIADRAISAGSFTVNPSASSGLPVALTVVTGSASISGPVGGVFTVTPTAPGLITLQATQAGQLASTAYESNMLRQTFTASGITLLAITAPPVSQSVVTGTTANFSVTASGTTALSYQWQKNGVNISGATSASLTLTNVQLSDAGTYSVVATNSAGSVTSSGAILTISSDAFLTKLFNLVLQRAPTQAELDTYNAALNIGGTRADVLGTLLNTATYQARELEAVIRLYFAAFNRMPDYMGLLSWSETLRTGAISLAGAGSAFAGSAEFVSTYGNLNNTQFVQQLYRNGLGREADPDGLNIWVGALNSGSVRGDVLAGFSESAEFQTDTAERVEIIRLYALLLGRMPVATELSSWLEFLQGDDEISIFLDSAEFLARFPGGGTNDQFVQTAFRGILRRNADAGAITSFSPALTAGTMTRTQLVALLFNSTEAQNAAEPVTRLYLASLRREPDAAGLDVWTTYVNAGNTLGALAEGIASSSEFQARYGGLSNPGYIEALYLGVLGRTSDSSGLAYWTSQLDTNASTRAEILIGFAQSQESITLFDPDVRTTLLSLALYNRLPTDAELALWHTYFATLIQQLREEFLNSGEFNNG